MVDDFSERELAEKAKHFDIRKVDQAFLDNPYPIYRVLREQYPVHQTPDGLVLSDPPQGFASSLPRPSQF